MNVVENSANKRLFHGHDCGAKFGTTLVSQVYLPLGTWNSSAIVESSQPSDAQCTQVGDDDIEKCEFTLPSSGQKLGIEFDSSFLSHR